jgi:hypothetical protein
MTPETSRLASELQQLAESVAIAAGDLLMDRPSSFELSEKTTAIDFATQMDLKASSAKRVRPAKVLQELPGLLIH